MNKLNLTLKILSIVALCMAIVYVGMSFYGKWDNHEVVSEYEYGR
jgi:hypothetical protein